MSCSGHLGTLKLWQVFVNIACIQLGTTVEVSLFDEMIIQGMKVARRESSYQTKSSVSNNMEQPNILEKLNVDFSNKDNIQPTNLLEARFPKSRFQFLTFKVTPPARGPGGVRYVTFRQRDVSRKYQEEDVGWSNGQFIMFVCNGSVYNCESILDPSCLRSVPSL